MNARFLGINLRAGYALPWLKAPWKLSAMVGGYFTTMFVTDNTFGYSNVSGPQFFPTITRSFSNGDSATAYVKFSPIAQSLSLLTPANRELALGGAWNHRLQNGQVLSLSLDFATLSLTTSSGKAIRSTTTTIGAGVGF